MLKMRALLSAMSLVLFPLLILGIGYSRAGLQRDLARDRRICGADHRRRCLCAGGVVPRSPRDASSDRRQSYRGRVDRVIGVLMSDLVAVQIVQHGGVTDASLDLFTHVVNSPTMIALNVIVGLHILGGVLTGLALFRTRLVRAGRA